jgi:hypothetical protein
MKPKKCVSGKTDYFRTNMVNLAFVEVIKT